MNEKTDWLMRRALVSSKGQIVSFWRRVHFASRKSKGEKSINSIRWRLISAADWKNGIHNHFVKFQYLPAVFAGKIWNPRQKAPYTIEIEQVFPFEG